jgi:AcrR family transcriptional regulator
MDERSLSRRQRERLRHRQEILEVALDLFSERGYHNVSMEEIARKAEFSVGTLYTFFHNKEELYKAMVLEKAEEFHNTLIKSLSISGNEYKKIKTFVDSLINVFMKNLKFVRIYLTETRGIPFKLKAGLDEKIKAQYEDILRKLADIFSAGIGNNIFKRIDPYLLAVALDGITSSFLVQYLEHPDEHPFDADLILSIFFDQVYEGGLNS